MASNKDNSFVSQLMDNITQGIGAIPENLEEAGDNISNAVSNIIVNPIKKVGDAIEWIGDLFEKEVTMTDHKAKLDLVFESFKNYRNKLSFDLMATAVTEFYAALINNENDVLTKNISLFKTLGLDGSLEKQLKEAYDDLTKVIGDKAPDNFVSDTMNKLAGIVSSAQDKMNTLKNDFGVSVDEDGVIKDDNKRTFAGEETNTFFLDGVLNVPGQKQTILPVIRIEDTKVADEIYYGDNLEVFTTKLTRVKDTVLLFFTYWYYQSNVMQDSYGRYFRVKVTFIDPKGILWCIQEGIQAPEALGAKGTQMVKVEYQYMNGDEVDSSVLYSGNLNVHVDNKYKDYLTFDSSFKLTGNGKIADSVTINRIYKQNGHLIDDGPLEFKYNRTEGSIYVYQCDYELKSEQYNIEIPIVCKMSRKASDLGLDTPTGDDLHLFYTFGSFNDTNDKEDSLISDATQVLSINAINQATILAFRRFASFPSTLVIDNTIVDEELYTNGVYVAADSINGLSKIDASTIKKLDDSYTVEDRNKEISVITEAITNTRNQLKTLLSMICLSYKASADKLLNMLKSIEYIYNTCIKTVDETVPEAIKTNSNSVTGESLGIIVINTEQRLTSITTMVGFFTDIDATLFGSGISEDGQTITDVDIAAVQSLRDNIAKYTSQLKSYLNVADIVQQFIELDVFVSDYGILLDTQPLYVNESRFFSTIINNKIDRTPAYSEQISDYMGNLLGLYTGSGSMMGLIQGFTFISSNNVDVDFNGWKNAVKSANSMPDEIASVLFTLFVLYRMDIRKIDNSNKLGIDTSAETMLLSYISDAGYIHKINTSDRYDNLRKDIVCLEDAEIDYRIVNPNESIITAIQVEGFPELTRLNALDLDYHYLSQYDDNDYNYVNFIVPLLLKSWNTTMKDCTTREEIVMKVINFLSIYYARNNGMRGLLLYKPIYQSFLLILKTLGINENLIVDDAQIVMESFIKLNDFLYRKDLSLLDKYFANDSVLYGLLFNPEIVNLL